MTTKHLGTKLTLACSSILALAGLTAFLGAKGVASDAQLQAGTTPQTGVVRRIIVVPSQDGSTVAVPPLSVQVDPSAPAQPGPSASAGASQPAGRSRGT